MIIPLKWCKPILPPTAVTCAYPWPVRLLPQSLTGQLPHEATPAAPGCGLGGYPGSQPGVTSLFSSLPSGWPGGMAPLDFDLRVPPPPPCFELPWTEKKLKGTHFLDQRNPLSPRISPSLRSNKLCGYRLEPATTD
jgi:hypothetical protein